MTIKSIDSESVDKITSGQVVINVASALKELVENSLDAGATVVDVKINSHGRDGFSVQDNGSGIDPSDFSLVGAKHATSKLETFEDLGRVKTLGFRGEALSSLCALAKVVITTRGNQIELGQDGSIASQTTVPTPNGTLVAVTGLFNHLPVRRKDLERNYQREFSKTIALLQEYALISPARLTVEHLQKGRKSVVLKSQGSNLLQRIACVYGSSRVSSLLSVNIPLGLESCLVGYISEPVFGKGDPSSDRQMLYINGRPTKQQRLSRTIVDIYKQFNFSESPMFVLDVQVPPSSFDVNVTPDKRLVLLRDESSLSQAIREGLVNAFNNNGHSVPHRGETSQPQPKRARQTFIALDKFAGSGEMMAQTDKHNSPQDDQHEAEKDFEEPNIVDPSTPKEVTEPNDKVNQPVSRESKLARNLPAPLEPRRKLSRADLSSFSAGSDSARARVMNSSSAPSSRGYVSGSRHINSIIFTDDVDVDFDDYGLNSSSRPGNGPPQPSADSEQLRFNPSSPAADFHLSGFIPASELSSELSHDVASSSLSSARSLRSQRARLASAPLKDSDVIHLNEPDTCKGIGQASNMTVGNAQDRTKTALPPIDSLGDELLAAGPADSVDECCIAVLTDETATSVSSSMSQVKTKAPRNSPLSCHISFPITINDVQKASTGLVVSETKKTPDVKQFAVDESNAEEKLNLTIRKHDFADMRIVGQFNLGFILVAKSSSRHDDLFVIDQHASDEIYNFERLQKVTVLNRQPLLAPQLIELSAVEELTVRDHLDIFEKNGFSIKIDDDAPPGQQCRLSAKPYSKNTIFDENDVQELVYKIREDPGNENVRCSKLRAMFAMRACRSSIMIGRSLSRSTMRKVVDHLGTLDKPWNCPHGRPTVRHITSLS